jgi:DNA-binding transcriptional MerR regulator
MTSKRATPKAAVSVEPVRIPIEELARRTGFTVRNIREMQRRELVGSPELEGRKGLYSESHLTRLALIRRMQERGYSLSSIGELLQSWQRGAGIDEVVGVGRDLLTSSEPPAKSLSERELRKLFPELLTSRALRQKALAVELIVGSQDKFMAPNAELARLTRMFVDAGVPLAAVLADFEAVHEDVERIMARARASFVKHLFAELQGAETQLDRLREATLLVAKLRPALIRIVTLMLSAAAERGAPLPVAEQPKSASRRPTKPKTPR